MTRPARSDAAHSHGSATPALALLAATLFIFLSAEMLPVGLLPELSVAFSISPGTAGLLLSCYAIIAAIAGIPITNLTASWPRHRLLMIALLTLATSQLVFALSTTFWLALASRAVAALLHTTVWAIVPVIASKLGGPASGKATSYVFLGSALGLVLGTPAVAGLGQAFGWRFVAGLIAVLAAGLAVLLRVILPTLKPSQQHHRRGGVAHRLTLLLPRGLNSRVLLVSSATAVLVLGHYCAYTYFALIFADKGGSQSFWPLTLVIFGGFGLIGVLGAGRWIDRYRTPVSLGVLLLLPVALLAILLLPLAGLYPATAMWGAAIAAVPLVMQSAVIRASADTADESSAIYVVAFQIGISGGSWLGGLLLSSAGINGTLVMAILLTGIVGLALVPFRRVFR